jgi:hypothetical protein
VLMGRLYARFSWLSFEPHLSSAIRIVVIESRNGGWAACSHPADWQLFTARYGVCWVFVGDE